MTATCANRDEWLGASLYDDLPVSDALSAEEHLKACDSCRAEAKSLATFVKRLPEAAPIPSSPRARRFPAAAVAAAIILAALAGFFAGRRPPPVVAKIDPPKPAPVVTVAPAQVAVPASASLFSPEMAAFMGNGSASLSAAEREALRTRIK